MTKRTKIAAKPAKPERVPVRVVVEASDELAPVYANYAEATVGNHEILISFAAVPIKLNASRSEEAKTGVLRIEPTVQVVIPPTLLIGFIRALNTTKDLFEKMNGPIRDADAPAS